MKCNPLIPLILVNTLTAVGCSPIRPSEAVSTVVIDSLLETSPTQDTRSLPWRLDTAWQGGDLGGSALRAASIEHVVRQLDSSWPAAQSNLDLLNPVSVGLKKTSERKPNTPTPTTQNSAKTDPLSISRAWRKYCHHQLDMRPAEHALIAHTAIPFEVLKQGCHPNSLLK